MKRIFKMSNGETVLSYDAWEQMYKSKDDKHWKSGRSAESLAKYWTMTQSNDFFKMFEDANMKILNLGIGHIEKEEIFDCAIGRHSMCDLCFPVVETKTGTITVSIEAKVDEGFGNLNIGNYYKKAEREILESNPRSEKVKRIESMYELLTGRPYKIECSVKTEFNSLRFQLLSGLLGCIAETQRNVKSSRAVFIVHCFKTDLYKEKAGLANKNHLDSLLKFFGVSKTIKSGDIVELDIKFHESTPFTLIKSSFNKKVYLGFLETVI